MFCTKCKCCTAMWWSGFFALAALMHLLRLVMRVQLQVGTFAVPPVTSIAVAIIAAILAFLFYKKGCGTCGCAGSK